MEAEVKIGELKSKATPTSADLYCPCAACSPVSPVSQIQHSVVDEHGKDITAGTKFQPPYTRVYLHHLLHTPEMSTHAFLAMHNLSILDAFFTGIRTVIEECGPTAFGDEVARFCECYDEKQIMIDEARKDWKVVDLARGKGRLAREKKHELRVRGD
jgi:Queuine tRNA-ribosyltransferase